MRRVLSLIAVLVGTGGLLADGPKKLLLIGQGPDGHPPGTHEYMDGLKVLEKVLKPIKDLDVTVVKADGKWENGPELIDRSDGVVLFVSEGAKWVQQDEKRWAAFQRAAKRGAGLSVLHWGMGCKEAKYIDPFVKLFGGCHGGPDRKYVVLEVDPARAVKHPITYGVLFGKVKDEFYYQLKFVGMGPEAPVPLVTVTIDGESHVVAWLWDRPDNGGRSFGFSGLHFHENWKRADYRRFIAQGVLYSLDLPIPRDGIPVED